MPTDRVLCGHIRAWWDNHPKCLSWSSCCMLSTCLICNFLSKKPWDLADKRRSLYSVRSAMKKKLAKKVKVQTILMTVLFLMGSPPQSALLTGKKTHLGGTNMSAEWHPKYVHQALVPRHGTRHQSASPGTGQPGTRLPGTGKPGTGQLITGQPSTWLLGTDQPDTRQSITSQLGTGLPGTGQPGLG